MNANSTEVVPLRPTCPPPRCGRRGGPGGALKLVAKIAAVIIALNHIPMYPFLHVSRSASGTVLLRAEALRLAMLRAFFRWIVPAECSVNCECCFKRERAPARAHLLCGVCLVDSDRILSCDHPSSAGSPGHVSSRPPTLSSSTVIPT